MNGKRGRRLRRGRGLISGTLPPATEAVPSTELVGWAEPLRSAALSPDATRAAVAEALGLNVADVRALSDEAAARALARLRSLADQADRLATAAEADDLTGALRRGAGLAAMGREMAHARRAADSRLCVAFIDIDGLKLVNDTLGHTAGDSLLRELVAVLRERLRAYDLVIRYGGDEFVIVLPGLGLSGGERLFQQIVERLTARTEGRSISVGLAELTDGDDVPALLARADAALVAQRRVRSTARTN